MNRLKRWTNSKPWRGIKVISPEKIAMAKARGACETPAPGADISSVSQSHLAWAEGMDIFAPQEVADMILSLSVNLGLKTIGTAALTLLSGGGYGYGYGSGGDGYGGYGYGYGGSGYG